MLEEFKTRNQVAYERYDSLTKQEQGIIDRWQALEYRLNPPAAPVSGNQNSKLFGKNDPYRIIDTRRAVGYDKGKEGRGNELSPAGQGWAQPNQAKPGTPNAYAEYLAYKQKVQARQQRLALEQALQEQILQELTERVEARPQAVAYNGADGFASGGYETGGTGGVDDNYGAGDLFKPSGLDSGAGADSVLPAAGTGETTGQILREGESETVTNNQGKEIDITPGKNHTTTSKNPDYKGEPNSSVDILDKDGNVVTRRWFDENGNAIRDVDMTNHGNPKQHPEWPHEHFWEYGPDGKPTSR